MSDFKNSICSSTDILERRNLPLLAKTVLALNKFSSPDINTQTKATTIKTTTVTTTTTTTTATATTVTRATTATVTQPHIQTNV
ncbi:hypothetical protein X798_08124 [Onchocerca flexuosa]|uniref:Uncharacterized protein n=1 Tax=Onchocerca flexuosa TaxID=387005 RepID=A0A238BIS1_9BILA|nr:hypothetical protein X798_08124 [Onchocerca flexuosa]